jgi:pimeloyl-ACP methyl ester carboxylesterase
MMSQVTRQQRRSRRYAVHLALALALMTALWIGWSELYPSEERALRELVHDQLAVWFPEVMAPHADGHGLAPWHRTGSIGDQTHLDQRNLRALLIHGLDEPGIIWDDLAPALTEAGFDVWELRYPNDQGLDRSAAYLADQWRMLPDDRPVVLIGHSMGGLVAREFVGHWRHPVGEPAKAGGAPVAGVIMVGTPNHGSDWARLRIWLELREHFEDARQRRFSLFAGLRDGLGEAKIDLRPDSEFLRALNARPWPDSVERLIIGARLVGTPAQLGAGLDAAADEVGSEALRQSLHDWFDQLGERLGDGAVSTDSLHLDDAAEPVIVSGSHRTMLRRLSDGDPEPPAVPLIVEQIQTWSETR